MVGGPAKANGELVDDSTPVLSGSFHGTSATALIIISRKKGLVWSSGAKKNKSNQRTRMQSRKTLL